MSHPDRPRVRGTKDPEPQEALDAGAKKKAEPGEDKKRKPVFRFARLDGRDTLKYEDTADK